MSTVNSVFCENSLAEAVQRFEHWRATREKRGPIPDELWSLAKSLGQRYKCSDLAKALKINHSELKNRLIHNESATQTATFLECFAQPSPLAPENKGIAINFICKNGNPVTINGLQRADIVSVISSLIGGK